MVPGLYTVPISKYDGSQTSQIYFGALVVQACF